jgi:hypothetical protein
VISIKETESKKVLIRPILSRLLTILNTDRRYSKSLYVIGHLDAADSYALLDEKVKEQEHLNRACDIVVSQIEEETDQTKIAELKIQRDMILEMIENRIPRVTF